MNVPAMLMFAALSSQGVGFFVETPAWMPTNIEPRFIAFGNMENGATNTAAHGAEVVRATTKSAAAVCSLCDGAAERIYALNEGDLSAAFPALAPLCPTNCPTNTVWRWSDTLHIRPGAAADAFALWLYNGAPAVALRQAGGEVLHPFDPFASDWLVGKYADAAERPYSTQWGKVLDGAESAPSNGAFRAKELLNWPTFGFVVSPMPYAAAEFCTNRWSLFGSAFTDAARATVETLPGILSNLHLRCGFKIQRWYEPDPDYASPTYFFDVDFDPVDAVLGERDAMLCRNRWRGQCDDWFGHTARLDRRLLGFCNHALGHMECFYRTDESVVYNPVAEASLLQTRVYVAEASFPVLTNEASVVVRNWALAAVTNEFYCVTNKSASSPLPYCTLSGASAGYDTVANTSTGTLAHATQSQVMDYVNGLGLGGDCQFVWFHVFGSDNSTTFTIQPYAWSSRGGSRFSFAPSPLTLSFVASADVSAWQTWVLGRSAKWTAYDPDDTRLKESQLLPIAGLRKGLVSTVHVEGFDTLLYCTNITDGGMAAVSDWASNINNREGAYCRIGNYETTDMDDFINDELFESRALYYSVFGKVGAYMDEPQRGLVESMRDDFGFPNTNVVLSFRPYAQERKPSPSFTNYTDTVNYALHVRFEYDYGTLGEFVPDGDRPIEVYDENSLMDDESFPLFLGHIGAALDREASTGLEGATNAPGRAASARRFLISETRLRRFNMRYDNEEETDE